MFRAFPMAVLAALAGAAWADGCFIEPIDLDERASGATGVASTEQKAVIIELPEGREALILQTTYQGPADRFAWVVPVPGQPSEDDVSLADPALFAELLVVTAPKVETRIKAPKQQTQMMMKGTASEDAPGMDGIEADMEQFVTVHEQFEVGDFDATVLSSVRAGALEEWLNENGYRMPSGAAGIFAHYVERKWTFVALKMRAGVVEAKPLIEDVDPVCICFDTDQLVYPLRISRISSRAKTAMTLLLVSDKALKCDQLPDAELPLGKKLKRTSYATVRREAVASGPASMLCEYRGDAGEEALQLRLDRELWPSPIRPGASARLFTTRYWTLLDLNEMEDLTFSNLGTPTTHRLHISRVGELYIPLIKRIHASPTKLAILFTVLGALICLLQARLVDLRFAAGPGSLISAAVASLAMVAALIAFGGWGIVLAVVAVPLWLTSRPRRTENIPPRSRATGRVLAALVAAGAGGGMYVSYMLLRYGGSFLYSRGLGDALEGIISGYASVLPTTLLIAVQGVWLALIAAYLRRALKGSGPRWLLILHALFPLCVAAFVALILDRRGVELWDAVKPYFGDESLWGKALFVSQISLVGLTFAAQLLLLSFLLTAGFMGDRARAAAQPLTRTLIALALIGAAITGVGLVQANAGSGGYIHTGHEEIDDALRSLDGSLTRSRDEFGCYPARWQDMFSGRVPIEGLDSSGNIVPIDASKHTPIPASDPPSDPLTGRDNTWIYEPTGSPMIDSGGYEITIRYLPQ